MITIKKGESFLIRFRLLQDGVTLTPDILDGLKACVGSDLEKSWPGGGLGYDASTGKWYFRFTAEESELLEEGILPLCCHLTYPDSTVLIRQIARVRVKRDPCEEE